MNWYGVVQEDLVVDCRVADKVLSKFTNRSQRELIIHMKVCKEVKFTGQLFCPVHDGRQIRIVVVYE